MPRYPIELDLTGRTALVVGLGSVGRRKAQGLLTVGAHVMGVDPLGLGADASLDAVTILAEPYHRRHLQGVCLAFAASTPEVNRRVVADARIAGIWVNSASDPNAGDFHVPAVWRAGGITLAVSTSGASPALAKSLRDQAAAALGEAAAGLAATLAELRPLVFARVENPEIRRKILADWGDPRWINVFAEGGAEAVREALSLIIDRELGNTFDETKT